MAHPLIRPATAADLEHILRIESQSFASPNWNAMTFAQYETVVADLDNQVVGVLVSRQTYPGDPKSLPESEILNLAVDPCFRRQGIGSALLRWTLQRPGVFFLEVRESNWEAQALYQKFDFVVISRRPAYYENPLECALVMKMKNC